MHELRDIYKIRFIFDYLRLYGERHMVNRSHLNIKAIAIGVLVDIGGSILAALIFAIVYSIILSQKGHSTAEIESMMTASSLVYLVSLK